MNTFSKILIWIINTLSNIGLWLLHNGWIILITIVLFIILGIIIYTVFKIIKSITKK